MMLIFISMYKIYFLDITPRKLKHVWGYISHCRNSIDTFINLDEFYLKIFLEDRE